MDGSLPHVLLTEDAEPLKVTRLVGKARLEAGKIEMNDTKLDSPDGKFQLTGTATLKGELDLKLAGTLNSAAVAGYTITGTLEAPRVNSSSSSETQARLKPDPPK
jgi:AsmA-like C-terminal region